MKVLVVDRKDVYIEYVDAKINGKDSWSWEKKRTVKGTQEGIVTFEKKSLKINVYNKYTDKLMGTTTEDKWKEDFNIMLETEGETEI